MKTIIVTDQAQEWFDVPGATVIAARTYLAEPEGGRDENVRVLNLCRTGRYQGRGYYVSLLAEARGHKVIPSVRAINDLRRRSLYGLDIDDLNQKLQKFLPHGGRPVR